MRRVLFALAAAALFAPAARAAPASTNDSSVFSPPRIKLGEGTALVVQGRLHAAEIPLRQALALDPRLAEGHYNLGVVLRATGRPDEAIAEYRLALALSPPNDAPSRAKSLYGIALAAEDTNDPARAARAWQDYIRFDERFPAACPAVAIARTHLANEEHELALRRPIIPGTQKAGR